MMVLLLLIHLLMGSFYMCSRNNQLIEKNKSTANNNHFYEIVAKYDIKNKMIKYGKNIAIQGEIIGPKINGNNHKVKEISYHVYNIYDIDNQKYLNWNNIIAITDELDLQTVTLVYSGIMKKNGFQSKHCWLLLINKNIQLGNQQKV